MKNLNINYSIEEAENLIHSLQEKIIQTKEEESVKILKKYSKEINDKYIQTVVNYA